MTNGKIPLYCILIEPVYGVSLKESSSYTQSGVIYEIKETWSPLSKLPVKYLDGAGNVQSGGIAQSGAMLFYGHSMEGIHRAALVELKEQLKGFYQKKASLTEFHTATLLELKKSGNNAALEARLQNIVNHIDVATFLVRRYCKAWNAITVSITKTLKGLGKTVSLFSFPDHYPTDSPDESTVDPLTTTDVTSQDATPTEAEELPLAMTENVPAATPEPPVVPVEKKEIEYDLYVATTRPPQDNKSYSAGCAFLLLNKDTAEIFENGRAVATKSLFRLDIVNILDVFGANLIPNTTDDATIIVNVITVEKHLEAVFNGNMLAKFAKNDWKKKDGKDVVHMDKWKDLLEATQNVTMKATLIPRTTTTPDDKMKHCFEKAIELATAEHKKVYEQQA